MGTYSINASVQYNDMRGTASADWQQSMADLNDFAKDNGIDTVKYHPIGIKIDLGESGEGEIYPGLVSIIAANKEVVGQTYDEVKEYSERNGTIPIVVFYIKQDFYDVLKKLKRFAVTLMSGYKDIDNYELASEINLR